MTTNVNPNPTTTTQTTLPSVPEVGILTDAHHPACTEDPSTRILGKPVKPPVARHYSWSDLRLLNERAWASESDVFPVSKSLDSALKKNTAFIKRLRTGINAAAQQTFLTDIRTLSLHKYLSEIISACYEGLCKLKSPGEIATGVEITSALHQRFGPGEFTRQIGWLLGRGLSTPDKGQLKALSQEVREREEKERLSRHRVLLRVVTELWLVGVLKTLDDIEKPDDVGAKGKDGVVGLGGKAIDGPVKRVAP
ncbi:hypothetical protein ASPCADRAFT_6512, partial [Aspergillus carbonarius ITEM 5010]